MNVTPQQIGTLIKDSKNDSTLRELLQYLFSYKENINTFAEVVFPGVVTNKIPKFHKEIYEILFSSGNSALAAPRGHAKSSITGIIYLIFCVVNNLEKYIVYISQNHTKTVQFLDPIRYEFKNNRMLQFIYGDITLRKSTDDNDKDREDCFDVLGCRVEAVSFEKNLRGFKYRNIRPTLIKQYNGKIFSACNENLENLLWKDRFTKKILSQIKKDIGSVAFQQEYLNNPIDNTSSLIKREWITQCFREDLSQEDVLKLEFGMKTLGCDFAFSDRITADESAFVSLGEKDGFYYLLGSQKHKGLSLTEQMNIIKNELNEKHQYDQIGLEENSIKGISKDISQWDMPITLFWTSASDPAGRLKPNYDYLAKRHTVGKINLIMRLSTAFENKKFIIPYKTEEDKARADRILSECVSYALSDGKLVESGIHPDIPIGMGYALELINNYGAIFDFG